MVISPNYLQIYLKCQFQIGGGGLSNADVIKGGRWMLTVAEGGGGKNDQKIADVICKRSLINIMTKKR